MSGEAHDAVSAYTQVKMFDASRLLQLPQKECPTVGSGSLPKHLDNIDDPLAPLERNLCGHPMAGLLLEKILEEFLLQEGCEKHPNWECLYVYRQPQLFLSVYVDDKKWLEEKQV